MFYKIKAVNSLKLIITIITVFISLSLFSETLFAKEREILDNKPVYRGIVEWDKYVTDLEDVEEDSDLIIKGIIQEGKENLLISDTHGYTYTKVLVTEVLKGDKNLLNKIIIFSEPYFETVINDTPAYMINDNYLPAIFGNEYFLFLKEYTGDFELYKGVYILCYDEKGKYPVNDNVKKIRTNTSDFVDCLSNEELNLSTGGGTDEEIYRDIYKSVLDKYVLNSDKEINKPIENEEITTSRESESEGKTIITKSAEELGALNKNDRLLIPLRDVAELTGCRVEWDGNTKTACAKKGKNTVKFLINSNEYYVNDKVYELDIPAEIYDSKTYVPLRAVSEGLGVSIEYDSDNKTVTLSY